MEKPQSFENQIYHIYNRGIEKRITFLDQNDYKRFVHDLAAFNSTEPILSAVQRFSPKYSGFQISEVKPRKRLVELLVFTLMPNHFHLLVRPIIENGIVKFMQKLGTGYTMYFNKKYERVGSLFQGTYKKVVVTEEAHFIHLPFYIHANPLDNSFPQWREGRVSNFKKAMEYLENYRWSSFPDYIGKVNYPDVTQRKFLLKFFGGPQNYRKEFSRWLQTMDSANYHTAIDNLILEK